MPGQDWRIDEGDDGVAKRCSLFVHVYWVCDAQRVDVGYEGSVLSQDGSLSAVVGDMAEEGSQRSDHGFYQRAVVCLFVSLRAREWF